MSIDTTFHPLSMNSLVGVTATQIGGTSATGGTGQQLGVTTFRIRNITAAAAVLGWGQTAASAVITAPAANAPQNSITVAGGAAGGGPAVYLELPYGTFFISSVAAAFEIQGGMGGVGG